MSFATDYIDAQKSEYHSTVVSLRDITTTAFYKKYTKVYRSLAGSGHYPNSLLTHLFFILGRVRARNWWSDWQVHCSV